MAGLVALPSAPPLAAREPGAPTAPGFDAGSVVEAVRHNLAEVRPGALRTDDRLYRADIGPGGLALTMRTDDPGRFAGRASFELETTHALGRPVSPGSWTGAGNVATRALAPGVSERLTARDGVVEWDVVLERATPGDVSVVARVGAGGDPTRTREHVRWPVRDRRTVRMDELVVVDANGRHLHTAVPKADGRSVQLQVPAQKLAGAAYPVTLDPVVSPEYPVGDPLYSPSPVAEEYPAVAWSSTASEYLVVWSTTVPVGEDLEGTIHGARVTSGGVVLDQYGIEIATDAQDEARPAVAFDGTNFLVFWAGRVEVPSGPSPSPYPEYETDIFGVRVSTAGSLVGSPFTVSGATDNQVHPAVVWNGTHAMVVWEDYRNGGPEIWGSLVQAPTAGANFRIDDVDGRTPTVAWNGGLFLVAWQADESYYPVYHTKIRARLLESSGAPCACWTTAFDISTGAGDQSDPDVGSVGGVYLVAWSDERSGAYDVRGARVHFLDGAPAVMDSVSGGGLPISIATGDQSSPAVSSNGTDYVVAWADGRASLDIYARRVTTGGSLLAEGVVSADGSTQIYPDLAWSGTGFFAAWRDGRNNWDIYGSRLTSAGAGIDTSGIPITLAANGQYDPAVAWDGTNYLVVWADSRNGFDDIYGARVTGQGTVLDPAGIAIATGSSYKYGPRVAWSGSSYMVVWATSGGKGPGNIYAATVTAGVAGVPGVVSLGGWYPTVASNGSSFLVVWEKDSYPFYGDIAARRYNASGTVLGAEFNVSPSAPAEQYDPGVASDGSSFLVGWTDYRNATSDVYGTVVASDGSVADADGFAIAANAAYYEREPGVAWSGSEYLVAWEDNRNDGDIYSGRVSAGGALVGSALAVSSAAHQQAEPIVAWNGVSFVVAWVDERSGGRELYAARVERSPFAVSDAAGIAVATLSSYEDEREIDIVRAQKGRVAMVYERDAGPPFNNRRAFLRFFDHPHNDHFASAEVASGTVGCTTGVNIGATKQPGEPNHAGNPGGASVWYSWTPSITGPASFDPAGSSFAALLGVYTGSSVSTLTLIASSSSPASWYAVAGTTYRIAVDGAGGATGTINLCWTQTADVSAPNTTITSGPSGTVASNDPTFTFTSTEAGTFECSLNGSAYAACTTPKSYTDLGDATHTFAVRARDLANNLDPTPASRTWTIDTTAPNTTITSGPSGTVGSNDPTFTFTSTEAGTFECSLDAAPYAACPTPKSYTDLPDGSHTFNVRAVDGVGNTDASPATRTWTIDTVAPNTTITSGPSGTVGSNDPSFTFSTPDGATFECSLDGSAYAACTTPKSYTDVADGPHTFNVRAVDAAGNVDASPASRTWTIDTVAPDTTITSGPSGTVGSNDPSFTFSTPDGATFECSLDGAPYAACTTPKSYTDVADGSHTFNVRALDAVGNTDGSPASRTWTIDTAAPNTTITSGPSGTVASNDPSFTFTSTEAGTFECSLDGAPYTACTTPKSYTDLADGSHTFDVRALDTVGNTDASPASRTWTIDTTAPNTTITSGPSGTVSSNDPTFTFTSTESGSFECSLDGGPWVPCSPPWSYTDLPDGSHTLAVRAVDAVGNTDASPASRTWTIDTTAPNTTITSGPSGTVGSNDPTFTFTSTEAGTFECSLDGAPYAACTTPKSYTDVADGSHTFNVRAVDAVGNTDASPASRTWTIDTVAPDTTITSGPSGTVSSSDAEFTFSTPDGATFECSLDGSAFAACTTPKRYTGLADGSHTFNVRAVDAAGNTDASPATRTWSIDTVAPNTTITSGPSGTVGSNDPSFTFTSTEAGTFECSLDAAPYAACPTPKSYTDLPDGSHTFNVRAVDAVGNTDASPASRTWTIDTVGPDTSITSGPSGTDASNDPSFRFTSPEAGATFQCSLDAGAYEVCVPPKPYTDLPDGPHTFRVRAVDAVGNVDASPATRTWTIDTVGPDTSITSGPSGTVASNDPSFTFTSPEAGATFQCSLDAGAYAACTTPKSYTDVADGPHTFRVRAVDAVGNVDASPATRTWTIDTVAPNTTITSGPPSPTQSTTATLSFVSTEPGSFQCSLESEEAFAAAAFESCTSPTTYSGLADGSYRFIVQAVDGAGNADASPPTWDWDVDTTPPDTIITEGPPDHSNSQSATFKFIANEPATFECKLDGGAFVACTSPKTYTGVSEGAHNFEVRAIDAVGLVDPSPAPDLWEIDLTAPDTVITAGPPPVSDDDTATFEFHADEPVSSFRCTLDGDSEECRSPHTVSRLGQGPHTMTISAIDLAENIDPTGALVDWRFDGTGPDVDITRPTGSVYAFDVPYVDIGLMPIAVGRTITVEATATEDDIGGVVAFRFEVDGEVVPDAEVTHDGTTHSFVYRPPATDVYTVVAVAKNAAGTESSDSQLLLFVQDGIPSDVRFRTTMSASAATVTPGSIYKYTVTITNEGTETSLDTVVAVHLPVFTALAPWDPCPPMPLPEPDGGGGGICLVIDFPTPGASPGELDDPIHEQLFDIGPLAPGQSTTVDYNVRVEDGTPTTTLRTHAHVFAPLQDSTTTNVVDVGVVPGPAAAAVGAEPNGAGADEPGQTECGYYININQPPLTTRRSEPKGERPRVSGNVHDYVEPLAGPGRQQAHEANCAVFVTAGH